MPPDRETFTEADKKQNEKHGLGSDANQKDGVEAAEQEKPEAIYGISTSSMQSPALPLRLTCEQERAPDPPCEKLGTVLRLLQILEFEDAIAIDELQVFPLVYHPEQEMAENTLFVRAEKALSLDKYFHIRKEYSGYVLQMGQRGNPQRFNSHDRIMIDPATSRRLQPMTNIVPDVRGSILPEKLEQSDKLTSSSMVYGFNFGDKIWGKITCEVH